MSMPTPSATPDPPADATGMPTHIGKYRVLKRLGEGATAEVFLCHDAFKNREVAIKRVRPNTSGDAMDGRYSERFFAAEAALVGRLNHPNVVQIFDAVPDPVAPYLVMEHVAGSTLRPFCRADQLLSLELVVEIGFKCAMALGYVYRQGLIHRDVKPANLLVVLTNGAISENDAEAEDGSPYDAYRLTVRAGEKVAITMRSTAVDSYLVLGRMVNGEWVQVAYDDDGAGSNDARLEHTFDEGGEYIVRANTVGSDKSGAYTIRLERIGAMPSASPRRAPRP